MVSKFSHAIIVVLISIARSSGSLLHDSADSFNIAEGFREYSALNHSCERCVFYDGKTTHDQYLSMDPNDAVRKLLAVLEVICPSPSEGPKLSKPMQKTLGDQREALEGFFDATGGASWILKDLWKNSSVSYCEWIGISCLPSCNYIEDDNCPVVKIELPKNKLTGDFQVIWQSLSRLNRLERLDLSGNSIKGQLVFMDGPYLTHLQLSNNLISGTIPSLTGLSSLAYMDLSVNLLEGQMPSFSHNLQLSAVILDENRLSGTIPNFDNPTLKTISLSTNRFTGTLPSLRNIPSLGFFSASSNTLTGTIYFFEHHLLEELILHENGLTGTLPRFSSEIISGLSLYNNKLNGSIPELNAPLLRYYYINNNQLGGTISNLNIPMLQYLYFHNNKLTGTLSDVFMPRLQEYSVFNNKLTGSIPNYSGLPSVWFFDLYQNSLSGSIPNFSGMKNMRRMDLSSNKLAGSIPNFDLRYLRRLWLFNNLLSDQLPDLIMPNVRELFLSNNLLNGTLPTLAGCPEVVDIELNNNMIQYVLPQKLVKLQFLELANNNIQGSMPDLQNPATVFIDLHFNNISEPLPTWSSMINLQKLDLYENPYLIGPLPDGMDSYSKIIEVNMINTRMQAKLDKLLPATLTPSPIFQLQTSSDKYQCPVITTANKAALRPRIEMKSSYYRNVFCACLPGYYGFGDHCVECPSKCDCPDGNTLQNCFASPNVTSILDIIPCADPKSCKFRVPENRAEVLNDGYLEKCQKGYDDRGCSRCQDGYYRSGGKCNLCTAPFDALSIILFSILCIGGLYGIIRLSWLTQSEKTTGQLGIFLFYTQILHVLGSVMDIPFSQQSGRFVSDIGSFRVPSLDCIIGNSPAYLNLVNMSRVPGVILIAYLCFSFFKKKNDEKNTEKVISLLLLILDAVYFSVIKDIFSAFGCTLYDKGIGKWFVNAFAWIECSPVSRQYELLLLSIIPNILFGIAYPILVWKSAGMLKKIQYQSINRIQVGQVRKVLQGESSFLASHSSSKVTSTEMRQGNGNIIMKDPPRSSDSPSQVRSHSVWQAESGEAEVLPADSNFIEVLLAIQANRFQRIYQKDCYWWAMVRTVQSILFAFSAQFVPYTYPVILYFTLFVWIQATVYLQNHFKPYRQKIDTSLSGLSWGVLYASFFAAMILELVSGQTWLSWVIIVMNACFISYFLATYTKEALAKTFSTIINRNHE